MGSSKKGKIDSKGRIVIPKEFREKLGYRKGEKIIIKQENNKIILEKGNLKEFFGLEVERTGEPEWKKPEEIKKIWE